MNAWDNEDCGTKPGDTEPNGQKCLYHVSKKRSNSEVSYLYQWMCNMAIRGVEFSSRGYKIRKIFS